MIANANSRTRFLELAARFAEVNMELGPGDKPRFVESIKVDLLPLPGVDIVADVRNGLDFVPDNTVDAIYSSHFMEHISNVELVMRECWRVLKPGGRLHIIVPHFSNPFYYSDYTHASLWGLYTPCYFSKEAYFRRKVPQSYNDLDLRILDIELSFYSPHPGRYLFKKPFQLIFNMSKYMQELYEEMFVYLVPAYEVRILMEKRR